MYFSRSTAQGPRPLSELTMMMLLSRRRLRRRVSWKGSRLDVLFFFLKAAFTPLKKESSLRSTSMGIK